MANLRCFGVGVCATDPEVRSVGKTTVCVVNMVFKRSFKDNNGEWQEKPSFFKVQCWGDKGNKLAQSVKKGNRVFCEGEMVQESWETKEGEKRTSYALELKDFSQCVSNSKDNQTSTSVDKKSSPKDTKKKAPSPVSVPVNNESTNDDGDDELPF